MTLQILFELPATPQLEPVAPSRRITGLAFKNRMTATERKAIRAAAKVNEDIEDFMDLANSAVHIDLDRDDTRAGVLSLELAGLFAPGRALEILDGPVQDVERATV